MIGAIVAAAAAGRETMRYRAEYLHVPTSSRILFTVYVPLDDDPTSSVGEAMARRAATRWIEQTGLGPDCVFLSVAKTLGGGTDILSVPDPQDLPTRLPTMRQIAEGML